MAGGLVDMGGPDMAPKPPGRLGAPRRSRGAPRYPDNCYPAAGALWRR